MAFEGDLRHLSLGDVVQTLAMSRQNGTFVIRTSAEERRLVFGPKGCGLHQLRAAARERIGTWLVGRGKVTQEQLDQAIRTQRRRKDVPVEDLLLEAGAVGETAIREARAYAVAEGIYDLFLWKEGAFEFLASDGAAVASFGDVWFDVMSIAMESARRMDEASSLGASVPLEEVWRRFNEQAPEPEPSAAGGEDGLRLLRTIDGTRTTEGILAEFHLGRFDTWKLLLVLLQNGFIRPSSPEELSAAADELLRTKRHARAAALVRRVLERDPENESARRSLVQALVAAGEKRSAAAEGARLGSWLASAERHADAAEVYRQAVRLDPANLDALEGQARALLALGEQKQGSESARSACSLLLETGDHARAAALAEVALGACPEDVHLRISLANARIAAGETETGVLLLDDAASLLETSGDDDRRLLEVYRRIQQLQPTRRDCARRIEEIQASERIRRKRMVARLSIGVGAVLLSMVAVPLLRGPGVDARIADAVARADAGDVASAVESLDQLLADDLGEEEHGRVQEARRTLACRMVAPETVARVESLRRALEGPKAVLQKSGSEDLARALQACMEILDVFEGDTARRLAQADASALTAPRKAAAEDVEECLQSVSQAAAAAAARVAAARDRFTPEIFKREDQEELEELVGVAGEVAKLRASQDWATAATTFDQLRLRVPRPKDGSDVKTAANLAAAAEGFAHVEREGQRALALLRKRQLLDRAVQVQRQGQTLLLEGRVEDAGTQYQGFLTFCDELRRMEPKDLYEPLVRDYLDRMDMAKVPREQFARVEAIRRGEEEALAALARADVETAHRIRRALVADHPRVDFRTRFQLPLRVESRPPGAEVVLVDGTPEGRPIGRTPLPLVEIPLDGTTRILVRSPGYEERTEDRHGVTDDRGAVLSVELRKIPDFVSAGAGAVQAAATQCELGIVVAGRDGVVRRLSAADGSETARRNLSFLDGISGTPALHGGRLFVAALDKVLVLLDPNDLSEVKRIALGAAVRGSPLATPRGVVLADEGGRVQLVDADGRSLWSQQVGRVSVDPVLHGAEVLVVTLEGELVALDAASGVPLGRVRLPDAPRRTSPAVSGDVAYVADEDRRVTCVDLRKRSVRWSVALDGPIASRPAVSGGRLFVATTTGTLHVLDDSNGTTVRTVTAGAPVRQALLAVEDGVVLVNDRGGVLRVSAGGEVLWTHDLRDDVLAPPALGRGRIYVSTRKGVVQALRP